MSVRSSQRFTRHQPCPICAGFDDAPRGRGERCFGFLSSDSKFANCTCPEFAGTSPCNENSQTFAHKLDGDCKCGTRHDPSLAPLSTKKEIEAVYDYTDDQGQLLYQVVRFKPKRFAQRRPSGGGGWLWNLDGVRRVLYRLPEALAASTVFVAEGEKDCNSLHKIGLVATTNAGGCGKWRPEYSESLRGKHVTILPDNDPPGCKHALAVARSLLGTAASVRVAELPGPAKDVSSWLGLGHAKDELLRLAEEAPSLDLSGLAGLGDQWGLADRESENDSSNNDDPEIARLAALPLREYEHQREPAARRMGVRRGILDKLVGAARDGQDGGGPGQGRAFTPAEIEPWPQPVAGPQLLDELVRAVHQHVILTETEAQAVALWAIHAHAHDRASISPILAVTSPTPACGKSVLLKLLRLLVPRPLAVSNLTAASLFRTIECWGPTLLIDEADSYLKQNEELRGILDSGQDRKLAFVLRTTGDNHEPRSFCTWAPKAIAAIGKLPTTILSRSIRIQLQRMRGNERVDRLSGGQEEALKLLARKAARWVADHADNLSDDPPMPEQLRGRNADNWQSLIAIADQAGGP